MKWHTIEANGLDKTQAMGICGGAVIRSVHASQESYDSSESMVFIPGCQVVVGGCGEYATVRLNSPGKRGPL